MSCAGNRSGSDGPSSTCVNGSLLSPPATRNITWAAFAVKEHFAEDSESFSNFMVRFFALLEMFRSETPKDWVRQNPDDPEAEDVHPAVIYAAAEVGLDSKGHQMTS